MILRGILHKTILVIVASFFVLTTVESQLVEIYPPNIGVQTNEPSVGLSCNVTGLPPTTYIVWIYFPPWATTGFPIYSTIDSINRDTTNFTVRHSTLGTDAQSLELVINTVKPELATQYLCSLSPILGFGKTVHVVALDPIECPGATIDYDEGNEANLSCSVNFNDSTLTYFPNIMWYKDGLPISGANTIIESNNRRTSRLTKNVTSDDDDQEFICMVDFPSSDPDYTDNCSTIFYVKHNVSEVTFYPISSADAPAEVAVGETINCTADGRPEPIIEWYDVDGNLLSQFSELTVNENMRTWAQPVTIYCRARNSLDNGLTFAEVEGNYTFHVVDAVIIVQSSGVEAWVIAVAVIVPIVVIAAIAIAVFFIIRHRKKKKAKAKTTNGSAVTRPATTTATSTVYTAVPVADYSAVNRPPPTSAPRTTGSITSNRGPPGPDNHNGTGYGQNAGFGDLGVQTYGGSNQAVNNAYPPTRSSVHGSAQALGGVGVSMNPNPGYPVRGNPALNTSVTTNPRPSYPYSGSNSALNASLSLAPNAAPNASYGRQPSIASSSGRSHASSYNAAIPAMEMNRHYTPNDLSSMHGSEV